MVNVINAVKTAPGLWENVGSSLSVMKDFCSHTGPLDMPLLTWLPAVFAPLPAEAVSAVLCSQGIFS